MLKNKNIILFSALAFVLAEIILGITVQKVSGTANDIAAISSVILACVFAFLCQAKTGAYALTQIALVCTVFADLFLIIVEPRQQLIAMLFFSVAQICYFLRIFLLHAKMVTRIIHLSARVIAVIIALWLTFKVLQDKTDVLSLVSMFYFANLLLNIVFSFIQTKRSLLFPIGLLLFACCDALIGLSLLEEQYLTLPDDSFIHQLNQSSGNTAWMFYVPSQTLISLSLVKTKLQSL